MVLGTVPKFVCLCSGHRGPISTIVLWPAVGSSDILTENPERDYSVALFITKIKPLKHFYLLISGLVKYCGISPLSSPTHIAVCDTP